MIRDSKQTNNYQKESEHTGTTINNKVSDKDHYYYY